MNESYNNLHLLQPLSFLPLEVELMSEVTSEKLFIERAFGSGTRLMRIIRIHLMIYFLECPIKQSIDSVVILPTLLSLLRAPALRRVTCFPQVNYIFSFYTMHSDLT